MRPAGGVSWRPAAHACEYSLVPPAHAQWKESVDNSRAPTALDVPLCSRCRRGLSVCLGLLSQCDRAQRPQRAEDVV
ncbi:hypothetical protein NDU88_000077 [Pleurodeles waltl]|uniref:Uncharacterized protein n=1 Tax=Pleurodeles waltl TaxID=8319 RepID=A0AAV7U591_PLEWA|nr:hypothetical protein NDU88_000074 [Pleurodeles waltl]KAJ1183252.1 hypothetical protein NDU88_000077 [Pleurodeles waltl]